MSTTKEYKNYIVEQLSTLDEITCRPMMGGYLLYYKGLLFGGLYGGDRFLVKIVPSNEHFKMIKENPYPGAKLMYLVEDIDNREILKEIVLDTYQGLI